MGTNAADSPPINHSPRGDGPNSPQSRRTSNSSSTTTTTGARNLSSQWANIVRGGSSSNSIERDAAGPSIAAAAAAATIPPSSLPLVTEIPPPDPAPEPDYSPTKPLPLGNAVAEAPPESSDNSLNGSGNVVKAGKKPAWNKPSNGVIEAGPVMGAAWPPLSESAKASVKSSDSLKAPSDGSTPVSVSTVPVIASSPLKTTTTNNSNPNSTPNHVLSARQKPSKRGGGMGPANNGVFVPPPVEMPHSTPDKPAAAVAELLPDSSTRDHSHKNNWESGPRGPFLPQPHIGADQPRGSFRRVNGVPRGGGDGNYHSGYGNRRDQERTSYEWNQPQGFSSRDVHMRQPRVVPRNFIRPPPPAPPFVSHPPIRPYAPPMGFPDLPAPQYYIAVPPPESLRGGPFVAHPSPPPPVFYSSPPDAQLRTMLVKQIDYYFSSENLCKDLFLRRNMDEHGWVPVSLIAKFNRVKLLTNNIQFILDAVRMSTIVEVQGEKLRKYNDWMNWILPPSRSAPSSSPQSPGISNYDMLATNIQKVGLEEWTGNNNSMNGPVYPHTEGVVTRSSSGESNSQSQVAIPTGTSNVEGMGQTIHQASSDGPMSTRSLGRGDSC